MLLDTHVLAWFLFQPNNIGKALVRKFDRIGQAFFSPLSIFELAQVEKKLGYKLPDDLVEVIMSFGLQELPLYASHSLQAKRFGTLINTDPIDRLLISQASSEEMAFYTADRRLLSLDFAWIKDATI
jgi:PIN domain nuclease of toxin-antitoxin system